MWVIKLGGSVTRHSSLTQWLQLVARWGNGKVILVPGGGLFAEAVREFQSMRSALPEGHLNQSQAHALAVYAMDQMARSFVAIMPELVLVRNPLEIAERSWQHRGLVWLPSEMVLNPELCSDQELPQNWDVTSDSLAAWLAQQLDASQLLLIKSDDRLYPAQGQYSVAQLVAQGSLDVAFPRVNQAKPLTACVMHHSAALMFEHGFDELALTGRLVF